MQTVDRLSVGGVALEARSIGPGAGRGPTLVFLHGGLACLATWRDFPDQLTQATGCSALVYSRRGHGASDPGPARWPVSFMHDEALVWLPEVLHAAGIRKPILIGHSDGASIALIYAAARLPAAPQPLGLGLLAPHVFVEDVCVASIVALREEPARSDMLMRLSHHHGANAVPVFEAWTDVWLRDEFRSWNIEACVERAGCPLLVVQGDQDEYGTLAQVAAVKSRARAGVETLVLRGCGHVPHRDRAQETVAALAAFVGSPPLPGTLGTARPAGP